MPDTLRILTLNDGTVIAAGNDLDAMDRVAERLADLGIPYIVTLLGAYSQNILLAEKLPEARS